MSRTVLAPLAVLCGLAALSAGACGGTTDTVPAEAVLKIDRELADGGVVFLPAYIPGTVNSVPFQIQNHGRATLTVSGLALKLADGGTPGSSFPFTGLQVTVDGGAPDPLPVKVAGVGTLGGGAIGTAYVQFTYSPLSAGRVYGQLVVDSDAPARPHVVVPFTSCGTLADGGGC
jgi:hypothetical protein